MNVTHSCGCVVHWETAHGTLGDTIVETIARYPCPWHGGQHGDRYPPPGSDDAVLTDLGTMMAAQRISKGTGQMPRTTRR